jgi:hypothetical protein
MMGSDRAVWQPSRAAARGPAPTLTGPIATGLKYEYLQDRHLLVRPKNYVARQTPLLPDMIAQLRKHLAADCQNPHALVWHRPDGTPLSNTDENNALRDARVRAGIDRPTAKTHWLRHGCTALAGIPIAACAGVSGHGSEQASDPRAASAQRRGTAHRAGPR